MTPEKERDIPLCLDFLYPNHLDELLLENFDSECRKQLLF